MARRTAWLNWLRLLRRWLAERPSYMLLTASDGRLAAARPERFANAWVGVMLLSLAWGVLSTLLWGAAWALFRPQGVHFAPAAVVLTVFLLWPFRRAAVALAETVGGDAPTARALAAALFVAVLCLALLGLKATPYHNERPLPGWLAWVRPRGELYRVLVLAPVWGGWAMLITGQFRRPVEGTEAAVAAFSRGCGAVAAAACMAVPGVLTWVYFGYLWGWEATMSGAAIAAAVGGGLALSARTGGLTRAALLAANVVTQLAFLASCLANR
jgi:hypothetical protein